MISIGGRGRSARRGQAFKAPIDPTSNKSDDGDHKEPLGSNEPKLSEAPTRSFEASTGTFESPARLFQAPLAQNPSANCYN